jgi:hypothetical protein
MDNKIIYVFDWDCTITTRHHYKFIHYYRSFMNLYYNDEEYKKINDKYLLRILSKKATDGINNRSDLDVIAINKLNTEINITTHVDILNSDILTYIIELLFGIHRFFALRDMFQVLHNKNIYIYIMTLGVGNDIIKLLKILLYGRDDIFQKINIYANNISGDRGALHLYNNGIEMQVTGNTYKSDILAQFLQSNTKVFYVDDDNANNNRLMKNGYNQHSNKYYFHNTLEKNGVGLTLDDIQTICNFEFTEPPLSGGNKSNYIKLKKYLQ